MRKAISVLLLFLPALLVAQVLTSYWEVKLRSQATGKLVPGKDVDLYQNGSKAYDLTESSTTPGVYYHNAVANGEYDIYVDGLSWKTGVWIGSNKLSIIADKFTSISSTGSSDTLKLAGQIQATTFIGDGSGLTGIASGTGGVTNAGSTTIGADTDLNGVGEIALQTKGVTRMTVKNDGNIEIDMKYGGTMKAIQDEFDERGLNPANFVSVEAAIDTAVARGGHTLDLTQKFAIAAAARDTIPAAVTIRPVRGGGLQVTRKLRIEAAVVDPGPTQWIFGNIDSLEFAPGSVDYVRPEWFGGANSASIQKAVNVLGNKGIVRLQGRDYTIDSTIRLSASQDSISIVGDKFSTVLKRTVNDTVFALYGTSRTTRIEQIFMSGVQFEGDLSHTEPYIYGSYFGKSKFSDLHFVDVKGPAFYMVQPWDVLLENSRFDGCGSDGDSTKAGLTIRSGLEDVANNVRLYDVTFEAPYGGHVAILGEHTSVDHSFYFVQCKFHGWSTSSSRATNQPTSPHFYADSVQGIQFVQSRWVWSPGQGPIIRMVSVGGVSFSQGVFAAQTSQPAIDFSDSRGVAFIDNTFNLSAGKDSTGYFGDLTTDGNEFVLINNVFVNGKTQANWANPQTTWPYFFANDKQILRDTTDVNFLRFTNVDSASQGAVLELFPSDVTAFKLKLRSDGHILLKRNSTAVATDIYPDGSGRLISQAGFSTGGNVYLGTSIQADSLRVLASVNTNTPSGATSYALPVYDKSGNLLGYIPVYASQW